MTGTDRSPLATEDDRAPDRLALLRGSDRDHLAALERFRDAELDRDGADRLGSRLLLGKAEVCAK
jgi:hypothetical protein